MSELVPLKYSSSMSDIRVIAFYLPQFHPIPENDTWWGNGFTEWTNVTRAKAHFTGHYQPKLPADLGYYDLRLPEAREAQADLARQYGIESFCYWHYWFDGDRLLERPFREVLASGRPNFPFCLGWANETWSGIWSGGDDRLIIKEQTYPGEEDDTRHFEALLPAFRDPRYTRVNGKPLFLIYRPRKIPHCQRLLAHWRRLASEAGLPGLHFVAHVDYCDRDWPAHEVGFDAVTIWPLGRVAEAGNYLLSRRIKRKLSRRRFPITGRIAERLWPGLDRVYDYSTIWPKLLAPENHVLPYYPMAVPNWDTTARYARKAIILHNSQPEHFRLHLRQVLERANTSTQGEGIVFLKSWNEWAEGNYVEPDTRFGRAYLQVIREELERTTSKAFSAPAETRG
jgi:hypothetical protein